MKIAVIPINFNVHLNEQFERNDATRANISRLQNIPHKTPFNPATIPLRMYHDSLTTQQQPQQQQQQQYVQPQQYVQQQQQPQQQQQQQISLLDEKLTALLVRLEEDKAEWAEESEQLKLKIQQDTQMGVAEAKIKKITNKRQKGEDNYVVYYHQSVHLKIYFR